MTKTVMLFLCVCIPGAIVSTYVLQIPFVGGVWGVLTILPLTLIFPEFGSTGPHVEYGFLWLIIKSTYAWTVLISYYFVIWAMFFFLAKLKKCLKTTVNSVEAGAA